MKHSNILQDNSGFTLIETLVAAVVLVVGIFALYSMQTTAIKFNANASGMTTSASWASDRIERLLALDYDDPLLNDDDANGIPGLGVVGAAADGTAVSPDGRYTIYWNTAAMINPNPSAPADSTLKAIRVTVQRSDFGVTKDVVLNYYKQKVF